MTALDTFYCTYLYDTCTYESIFSELLCDYLSKLPKTLERPPPPAPPWPRLAASVCNHCVRIWRSLSFSSFVIFVSVCGSPRLKASNVGMELI